MVVVIVVVVVVVAGVVVVVVVVVSGLGRRKRNPVGRLRDLNRLLRVRGSEGIDSSLTSDSSSLLTVAGASVLGLGLNLLLGLLKIETRLPVALSIVFSWNNSFFQF